MLTILGLENENYGKILKCLLELLDVEFMWINPEKILPVKNRKSHKSEAVKSDTFLMNAVMMAEY